MVTLSKGTVESGSAPVSLAMAKYNSNIEHDATDEYLQLLLDAAIQEAEDYTGVSMYRKTGVKIGLENWSKDVLLNVSPVTAISAITYKDEDGTDQTLNGSAYALVSKDGREYLQLTGEVSDMPTLHESTQYPIEVTMTTGYADEDFPASIKHGILLIFSESELFRESRKLTVSRSCRAKLRPYRINR